MYIEFMPVIAFDDLQKEMLTQYDIELEYTDLFSLWDVETYAFFDFKAIAEDPSEREHSELSYLVAIHLVDILPDHSYCLISACW